MNNGNNVIRNSIPGNQIPSDIHPKMRILAKGTRVVFDNIKISVPGGTRTTSMSWEIK